MYVGFLNTVEVKPPSSVVGSKILVSKKGSADGPNSDVNLRLGCKLFNLARKDCKEVNKLKNEDGYSCFYAFVQLPGHSSKTDFRLPITKNVRIKSLLETQQCFT